MVKANDRLNARNTDNVYQQQVVNGWVARDFLELQSRQLDKIGRVLARPTLIVPGETDERPVVLLMLAVLAVCWIGITSPGSLPGRRNENPATPDGPLPAEPMVGADPANTTPPRATEGSTSTTWP